MKKRVLDLYMSHQLRGLLQVYPGETRDIAIGNRSITVLIKEGGNVKGQDNSTVIPLTDEVSRALSIPTGRCLNIRRDGEVLRLGPLVGVLAGGYNKERSSFGPQNRLFREMITAMHRLNGVCYIFTGSNINWEKKIIHGYYCTSITGKSWKRKWFPFPDVCYNRYFDYNGNTLSRTALILAQQHGVKTFNTFVGGKWHVYKKLRKKAELVSHLPETCLLDPKTLYSMLYRYKEVYVKPPNGCKGDGIVRVSRRKAGYFLKTAGGATHICNSTAEAIKKIRYYTDSRMLLIQRSIKFSGKRHFDARILVQKDRYNKWQVTGIAGRIGGSGRITTNLHTGGHAEDLHKILFNRGFTPEQIIDINKELRTVALKIAELLESSSVCLGELGLDFMIDTEGKTWFLEANPKPGRRALSDIDRGIRVVAVSRPLEYACYLAGFE